MSKSTYFFLRSQATGKDRLEGKSASSEPPGGTQTAGDNAVPLRRFVGQYWFVELPGEHKASSTEEVAEALDSGRTVRAISGPFATGEEAALSLERYGEMLMDHDDE